MLKGIIIFGDPLSRDEVQEKDEVTGEMIKSGGELVIEGVCIVYNTGFESGAKPEDWRSAVMSHWMKVKGTGKGKEESSSVSTTKTLNRFEIEIWMVHVRRE